MLIVEKVTSNQEIRPDPISQQGLLSSNTPLLLETQAAAKETASSIQYLLERLDSADIAAEDVNEAGKAAVHAALRLGELLGIDGGVKIAATASGTQEPEISPMSTMESFGDTLLPSPSPSQSPSMPDLPPIQDASLSTLPFRHQGILNTHESAVANASYERLEFLGDAYLEVIASRLIYTRSPHLSAGRMSQVREALVKNETLAEYAVGYGFDKRAQLPRSHQRPGKLGIKTLGDIFEAYVAAVILADPRNGFKTAEAWLIDLWTPKFLEQTSQPKPNNNAKQVLAQKIMGKHIKVSYVDEKEPETCKSDGKTYYHMGVYLSGWGWTNLLLGTGRGLNKVEAGNQAAMTALANSSLIDQVAAVKQAHDAKVKEQRARQSNSKP